MHSGGNEDGGSGQVILFPFQFSHLEEEKCPPPRQPCTKQGLQAAQHLRFWGKAGLRQDS